MQVQSMPSKGNYSQKPKGHFYENLRYCETKNFDEKCDILTVFETRKLQKYQKGPFTIFFTADKTFSTSFCDTLSFSSPKLSHPTNAPRQKLPATVETSKNIKRAP